MKITKTAYKASNLKSLKQTANFGCNKCPCCGETRAMTIERTPLGFVTKGIQSGIQKTWAEGIFKMKHMKVDCYSCYTCGAEWESDPYQWT